MLPNAQAKLRTLGDKGATVSFSLLLCGNYYGFEKLGAAD